MPSTIVLQCVHLLKPDCSTLSCALPYNKDEKLTLFGAGVGFFASSCETSSFISALTSALALAPRLVPNRESNKDACAAISAAGGHVGAQQT